MAPDAVTQEGEAELTMFRDSVSRFLADELAPNFDGWRHSGPTPRSFFRSAGQYGLLCPEVPEQYGGVGGDFRYNAIVIEEVAKTGMAPTPFCVHSDILTGYLVKWGADHQKRRWLPAMVIGEVLGAIAMTEPGAGSDLQAIRTTARRDGESYVVDGQKTFISNGQNCDMVVVAAKTDPGAGARGISLFIVDTRLEGFNRGRKLKKMGLHEADTSEMFFDSLRVPADCLLGEEGRGFAILMSELPTERLSLSIGAIAAAEAAFAITLAYVKERRAFGQAIIDFQSNSFRLAELRAQIRAGRAFVDQCLARHLSGDFSAVDGAELKLVTTKLQCRVVDECLQLHGGYGFMDEYPISRMYTDARVQRIYGGSDEIMKLIIARTL